MNTPVIEPIRVHITFAENVLGKTMIQVIGDPVTFVATPEEADITLFTNPRDVEASFKPSKLYAYFHIATGAAPAMPTNVRCFTGISLPEVYALLAEVSKNLTRVQPEPKTLAVEVPLLPGALRILVIDDTPKHIDSAKRGLAGHHLTTATGYQEAMKLLGSEKFDVVLTDLHLPMSSQTMGDMFKLGELVPYGMLLMVEAVRQGARRVGVVTDLSHHDNPFSAAFDHYSQFLIPMGVANVRMMHAKMVDGAKDWADALSRLE
jgi:CheY-like chemotaxis protein